MEKMAMTKLFIATPMYGGMCSGFYTQCLMVTQSTLSANNIEMAFSFMYNESLITRARNALVHAFLKSDCTHLLFIDADIRWNAVDIVHLVNADKDVIGGIYPKKEINWATVKQAVEAGVKTEELTNHTGSWVVNLVDYVNEVTVRADQPLEVWATGTGMMLIKRDVFEKLKPVTPAYRNDVTDLSGTNKPGEEIYDFFALSIEPETNRLLSEDYHFCRQWRLIGGQVYIAPWMNLGHLGSYMFEGQLARS